MIKSFKLLWRVFQSFTYAFSYLPYAKWHYIIGVYFPENNSSRLFVSMCKMLCYCKTCCKIRSCYCRVMVKSPFIFIIRTYGSLASASEPGLDHFKNPHVIRYQYDRVVVSKMRVSSYFKQINCRIHSNLLYKHA